MIRCGARVEVVALPGIPVVQPGDDLAELIAAALARAECRVSDGDVVVVPSKVVSRAHGRFVDLSRVDPGERARELAARSGHDPRLVELVVRESSAVSRVAPGVLVVRHRCGFVVANAGIDLSNAAPPAGWIGPGPWAVLLPADPDAAAAELARELGEATGAVVGVVISDSFGRPFRLGTVGTAIGAAVIPPAFDQRGRRDLFGRRLEGTLTAVVDQVAAAADLVAGQGDEGRGAVLVRGLGFAPSAEGAGALLRPADGDLYA